MGSYDGTFETARVNKLGEVPTGSERDFNYMVVAGGKMMYLTAARLAVIRFVSTMSATADVLAMASMELDVGNVDCGSTITVKWRGKPVFVRHRNGEEMDSANAVDIGELRDPQTDAERVVGDPKWLIVLGVCTHLGCVPLTNAGAYKGWFCPCHGSHYDTSGRIRKGPAPLNLEVPEYSFMSDTMIKLG